MKNLAVKPWRVKLFGKLMGFAGALQNLPAKITPPPFRLIQIGSAFWQSRALYVATRLGIADALGDTRKSVDEIAQALALDADYLYRLLRMLGSLGIFRESAPKIFENSATSAYLRADHPRSVRAMILMHNSPEMTRPWTEALEPCLRDGEVPFARVHGAELFDYMDGHKDFDLLFSQAMDCVENLTGTDFLADFNWGAFTRIVDVGGSKGRKAISILQAHPDLRALIFDRPQIIEAARTHWQGQIAGEVLARLEFQGGDMFRELPTALSDEDLYIFFAIFHGLSDPQCRTVLDNFKLAASGKKPYLLFADMVAADIDIDPVVAAFDMQMLIGTHGRERTLGEWRALLENNGFELLKVLDTRSFVKFLIARPR